MPERMPHPPSGDGRAWDIAGSKSTPRANHHPTVKPTDLMRYLCRLVTPPNGTVLDPFMGSGSTGKAAALEGFDFIGIEREVEYLNIARARIEAAKQG
jgi:site-specific DNA-methyltransferase (adenine-specific)